MIKEVDDGLLINIRIVPNSSKTSVTKEDNGIIKVKVTAQPIENKANIALIEYLSKLLKLPKSSIKIVKGDTSKDKTLLLKTADDAKKKSVISFFDEL